MHCTDRQARQDRDIRIAAWAAVRVLEHHGHAGVAALLVDALEGRTVDHVDAGGAR